MSFPDPTAQETPDIDWAYVTKASPSGVAIVRVSVEEADKMRMASAESRPVAADFGDQLVRAFEAAVHRAQSRHAS